ncbi:hypothetical protein [Methanococcus aeolicus]|uniref:hypothetical protein n=1 Tax=Methanococcus aeolicus TaxID=42879 RepID=UPI0021CA577A|nr:hypothetical protein [Methanococcus aeolicus]UXM85049.1 hypothetical protein N6C89_01840 [Methanococcus aeolicus]
MNEQEESAVDKILKVLMNLSCSNCPSKCNCKNYLKNKPRMVAGKSSIKGIKI